MVEADQARVLEELAFADGILFGTPSIVGEALKPIWDLTTSIFAGTHGGKLASAFGSYGWSGEGVPHIIERLKQLHMRVPDEGFRVRFRPGEVDRLDAYEYGYNFGCLLQEKENPKKAGARRGWSSAWCAAPSSTPRWRSAPSAAWAGKTLSPVDEETVSFTNNTKSFYMILGNGAAGFSAAKAIRERDKTGSVILVSEAPYSAYNRPMLTKALLSGLEASQIAIEPESWYEENSVVQILGRRVTAVDPKEKEVTLSDGAKFKYTKLIYALGAECFIPPIEGTGKAQVVSIRHLEDVKKTEALIPGARHAAVIGGGGFGP